MFRVNKTEEVFTSNINSNRTLKEKFKLIAQSKAVKEFWERSREMETLEDYLKLIQFECLKHPTKIRQLLKAISGSLIALKCDENKPILQYEIDPTIDFDFYGSNVVSPHTVYQYMYVYDSKDAKKVNLYIIIYNWDRSNKKLQHAIKFFNSKINDISQKEAAKHIIDVISDTNTTVIPDTNTNTTEI